MSPPAALSLRGLTKCYDNGFLALDGLDLEETLLYHGGYYGMSRTDARRRAAEMIDVFDLRAKAHVRAPHLSGGMRRRLLLARALMHEPRLVILDEPTAGVDFELRM